MRELPSAKPPGWRNKRVKPPRRRPRKPPPRRPAPPQPRRNGCVARPKPRKKPPANSRSKPRSRRRAMPATPPARPRSAKAASAAASPGRASLHRGEAGRLQERIDHLGDDRAVALGLGARRVPFGVGLEGVPLFLAVGQRIELEQVIERLVRFADQHGPEPGLFDMILLPDLQGDRVEPL